jgi:CNT family concentrative nucleoside transporter
MPLQLISFFGVLVLLAAAYGLSWDRKRIRWRTITTALALQTGLGVVVFFTSWGQARLGDLTNLVNQVLGAGQAGIQFLFGALVSDQMFEVFGKPGFIFALRVLPVIIFLSSLVSVLYYLGVMQWVVRLIGGALRRLLGTSPAESLSAAANIFVGQTEAPLVIRPYIAGMTKS